mgnify:FL=1
MRFREIEVFVGHPDAGKTRMAIINPEHIMELRQCRLPGVGQGPEVADPSGGKWSKELKIAKERGLPLPTGRNYGRILMADGTIHTALLTKEELHKELSN